MVPAQRQQRPSVLMQLDAALAEDRASIDGMRQQRAAELVQRAAVSAGNGGDGASAEPLR